MKQCFPHLKHSNCTAVHRVDPAAAAGGLLHMPHDRSFLEYGDTVAQ